MAWLEKAVVRAYKVDVRVVLNQTMRLTGAPWICSRRFEAEVAREGSVGNQRCDFHTIGPCAFAFLLILPRPPGCRKRSLSPERISWKTLSDTLTPPSQEVRPYISWALFTHLSDS